MRKMFSITNLRVTYTIVSLFLSLSHSCIDWYTNTHTTAHRVKCCSSTSYETKCINAHAYMMVQAHAVVRVNGIEICVECVRRKRDEAKITKF